MDRVTNTTLVRKRTRLAGILHLAALAVFAIGLLVSLNPEVWFYSYLAIFFGLALYQIAQSNLRRWGPRHRQDELLFRQLRGLDGRYTLVSFPTPSLPDYLLVGPAGVQVLVTRARKGVYACRADRWWEESPGFLLFRLFRQPLGNPSADATAGIESVQRYLATQLEGDEQPPVAAVIVFTHPETRLRIDGCSFPVTTLKELRNHLRRAKGTLNQAEVAELREALASLAGDSDKS